VVKADGAATVSYRTYKLCSDDPTPPCDVVSGNALIDGGGVTMKVQSVVTANHRSILTATVLSATDPAIRPGSTERFTLDGDVIQSDFGTMCDDKAPAGACGA
jgi:hypothetical protein